MIYLRLMLPISMSAVAFLPACGQSATPAPTVKSEIEVKSQVSTQTSEAANPQSSKPPKPKEEWVVLEVSDNNGEYFLRVDRARRDLVDNPAYPQMILFHTLAVKSKNVDERLQSLHALEDAIKAKMEAINGCVLLQVRTEAAEFRDLAFAYGGKENEFDRPIKELLKEFPDRMNVHVQKAEWPLFKKAMEAK